MLYLRFDRRIDRFYYVKHSTPYPYFKQLIPEVVMHNIVEGFGKVYKNAI